MWYSAWCGDAWPVDRTVGNRPRPSTTRSSGACAVGVESGPSGCCAFTASADRTAGDEGVFLMTTPSRPPVVPLHRSTAADAGPRPAGRSNADAASVKASPHKVQPTAKSDVPLFRPEVLDAQGTRALGDVLIAQPLSTVVLTLVAVALAAGLLGLGYWGEYTRKTHVSGYLVPTAGEVKVFSRDVGTILESRVAEGQTVAKGDVLYVVSLERQSSEGVETQAVAMTELRQRRSSLESDLQGQRTLADVERRALMQRITAMDGELSRLTAEIDVQKQRVATTEKTLERYRDLQAKGLTSAELFDQKTNDVLDQQGRLHGLERNRLSMSRDIEALRAQVKALQIRAATERSAIGRGVSQLDQELAEYGSRRTFVVTAPASGTATAVLARVGQTANTTQPLVSILPENAELVGTSYRSVSRDRISGRRPDGRRCATAPFRTSGSAATGRACRRSPARSSCPAKRTCRFRCWNLPTESPWRSISSS